MQVFRSCGNADNPEALCPISIRNEQRSFHDAEKSLEEYFEMEEMQTQVTALKQQFESQGMTADIYAEGDSVCFDVTLGMEVPAENLDTIKTQLTDALDQQKATFEDLAKQLQDNSTNENVTIKITYSDSAGTELASATFAAAA